MDNLDVKSLIPHRGRMLLLDTLTSIDEVSAQGFYRVRGDEFFLDGHYPDKKIVPGAILCEMMAQLTAAFVGYTRKIPGIPILAEIHNAKFKRLAFPGETLTIKMRAIKDSFRVLHAACEVYVEENLIAAAELKIAVK